MPMSASAVAHHPLLVSSAPTVRPPIPVLIGSAICLHDDVLPAAGEIAIERFPCLLHRYAAVELLDHDRAAGELHAFGNALGPDRGDTGQDDHPGDHERVDPPAQEVIVRVLEDVHMSQMLSVWTCCRSASAISNSVCETNIDVKRFDARPIASVTAKPRIGPVPKLKRNAAEINAEMCVSTSVQMTRPNPALIDARTPRPASSSSLMRSKISTFESTPIPIVNTKPAMPGSVITAPT